MQVYYPFDITRHGLLTVLRVKVDKVLQYQQVLQALQNKFGNVSFVNMPKSKLWVLQSHAETNMYQVSERCGVLVVRLLSLCDETRLDADVGFIIKETRDAYKDISHIAQLRVVLYLPVGINLANTAVLRTFSSQGEQASDVYGNRLPPKTVGYTAIV